VHGNWLIKNVRNCKICGKLVYGNMEKCGACLMRKEKPKNDGNKNKIKYNRRECK